MCFFEEGVLRPALGHHPSAIEANTEAPPHSNGAVLCMGTRTLSGKLCVWPLLPLSADELWDQWGCCLPLPLSPVPTWDSRAVPLVTTLLTTTAALDPREWGMKGYHPGSSAHRAPLRGLRGYEPPNRGRCPPDHTTGPGLSAWCECGSLGSAAIKTQTAHTEGTGCEALAPGLSSDLFHR